MLNVYVVSDNYINYLRNIKGFKMVYDPKILVRTHERKYIGVVLEINSIKYFAPFSSPKASDFNADGSVRKSTISILRMVKDNQSKIDGKELVGTITINNMIPVPDSEISLYDVDNESDMNYKNLVLDELRWIQKNDTYLLSQCKNLYYLKANENSRRTEKNGKTLDATIDFCLIEKAYIEWIDSNNK